MNNKGFTLIELLAVIAILAIIGIITTPGILNSIDNSKKASNRVIYGNIKTAAKTLYEEIYYANSLFYKYDTSTGVTTNIVGDENGDGSIDNVINTISINVQTLVGNGFLSGINNEDTTGSNKNTKIVVNADNKDIGMCNIKITREKNGSKVCYKIEGSNEENCPTTADFGGNNQCN